MPTDAKIVASTTTPTPGRTGCADGRPNRGQQNDENTLYADIDAINLGQKNGGGGLVERRAIHVYGRAQGDDKTGDLGRNTQLLFGRSQG